MTQTIDREIQSHPSNPLGLDGIEFIEYATSRPQALGRVLEMMGFRPIARHRSREVLLYRQGAMNVVVNAHDAARPGSVVPAETAVISAVAFRVRDAAAAWALALERGAWAVPTHVEVMELNIPAIHGVGSSRIYFVDRYREFSIWSVDFVPIPEVDQHPPAVAGMHWFGIVQYIDMDRMDDWCEFYRELFGFTWRGWRGSNPRPLASEANTLSTELQPHLKRRERIIPEAGAPVPRHWPVTRLESTRWL